MLWDSWEAQAWFVVNTMCGITSELAKRMLQMGFRDVLGLVPVKTQVDQ